MTYPTFTDDERERLAHTHDDHEAALATTDDEVDSDTAAEADVDEPEAIDDADDSAADLDDPEPEPESVAAVDDETAGEPELDGPEAIDGETYADDETDAELDEPAVIDAEADSDDERGEDGDAADEEVTVDDADFSADDTDAAISDEAAREAGEVTTGDPGVMTEDVIVADLVDEDNCASPAMNDTTLDGEPVIDGHVVEPVATSAGMRPGDAPVAETMPPPADATAIHDRWQQAQLGFIDDPHAATEAARAIAVEALESHIDVLRARQAELDSWQGDGAPDTEVLRAAMRGYRDMVTSLTGV